MGKVKVARSKRPTAVTIGRAAAAAGLTPKAVRLYESRQLLAAPQRSAAGYRLYADADIARLRFIAAARQLGLHIDQIAEIIAAASDGHQPCTTTRAILAQRIDEIDQVVDELSALRTTLATAHAASVDTDRTDVSVCPVLENTHRRDADPADPR